MRSLLLAAAVVAGASLLQGVSASAGSGIPDAPSVDVVENADAETLTYGIAGSGWTPGSLVQIELCGNDARGGSADCALGTAQIVAADATGEVRGRLSTSPPPSPCPCVVRAVSLDSYDAATAPVRVPGVPEMPVGPDDADGPVAVAELTVTSRLVEDGSPWGPWIGTAPKRTLLLVVANTGSLPVEDAELSLTVGRSDPPTGFTEPVQLGSLPVGEIREISVPVELPALAWGEYRVRGEISGTTEPTDFTESTTSYPWLLVFLAVFAVLHFALVLLRRAIRRRLSDGGPPESGRSGQPPSAPAAPVLAIGPGERALGSGATSPSGDASVGSDLVYVVEVAERPGGRTVVLERSVKDRLVHEYRDERRHRAVYTVVGLRATKALISSLLGAGDDPFFPPPRQPRIVEMVSIPPIVTATEEGIEAASSQLGEWLGGELGFPVYLSSRRDGAGRRTSVRVGDGPDFGAVRTRPTASWLRLESGVPTATYRLEFGADLVEQLDAVVSDLQADGVLAFVGHSGTGSEVSLRTHDVEMLAAIRDRIAAAIPIRHEELCGLVPLRMLDGVSRRRLRRLGIEAADTFEYQLIALAESRALAAPRRSLPPAVADSDVSDLWGAPPSSGRNPAPAGNRTGLLVDSAHH